MEIRVIDGRMSTTEGVHNHIEERVTRALDHVSARIRDVEVHLDDVNGPKGGLDKRCVIHARLRAGDPLIVEERADEYYGAIDAAIARLKRAVGRVIDKRKTRGQRR